MNEDEVKQETPVENEEVNEDEFLDEHPVEPIVAEEPKPEATEEEKPVEEPKEEEPPRRPVLKSYEYEDKRLEDIENARIIWNKGYRKMSLIKMIVAVVVLTLIIVGWIVPTLTMPNAGPVPLYIALGIAAAGILAIVGFGFIQKKKDREGVAAYFTAYYNALNGYVFDGLDIEVNGNYENKVDDAEVEASGLYPGFAQVGSREAITFTYKNMDCAIADMAVQKNASKGLETCFVGKYLRTHNTLEFPCEGKLFIYFKGNSRAIPPLVIADMQPIEENEKYAVYGPEPLKKILTHKLKTALNQIRTDSLLVDVAIAIEPGRTYWALGYEDDLMVLPNKDAFDPYYVMEFKKQIRMFLDIALLMNGAQEE